MPIRFLVNHESEHILPLKLYTIGFQEQTHLIRHNGFSASQVLLSKKGQGIIRMFDEEDRIVSPSHAAVIREGVPHEYFPISNEPWEVSFVTFTGDQAIPLLDHMGWEKITVLTINSVGKLWTLLDDLWNIAEQKDEWVASELIYAFLLELQRQTMNGQDNLGQITVKTTQEKIILQAVDFLNEHYPEPILLSHVAHSLGYSQQHLNRLFRKIYGMTAQQYLQRIRLQSAIFLLEKHPDMLVQEVAARIGLDTGHFIRIFRRSYGASPGKIRSEFKV